MPIGNCRLPAQCETKNFAAYRNYLSHINRLTRSVASWVLRHTTFWSLFWLYLKIQYRFEFQLISMNPINIARQLTQTSQKLAVAAVPWTWSNFERCLRLIGLNDREEEKNFLPIYFHVMGYILNCWETLCIAASAISSRAQFTWNRSDTLTRAAGDMASLRHHCIVSEGSISGSRVLVGRWRKRY